MSMTRQFQDPAQVAERNLQIQKLLDAIANYKPGPQQIENMNIAKKQMMKNIQRKFLKSNVNQAYKFPFLIARQTQIQQDCQLQQIKLDETYNLLNQNFSQFQESTHMISKQKKALQQNIRKTNQKQNNKQEHCFLDVGLKNRYLIDQNKVKRLLKNGFQPHTPKAVKRQIVLTNRKKAITQVTSKKVEKQNIKNQLTKVSQMPTSISIKSKLKVKQTNGILNQTSKQMQIRTQNNINFQPCYDSSLANNLFKQVFNKNDLFECVQDNRFQDLSATSKQCEGNPAVLQEIPQQALSLIYKLNQNIDQNTNFQLPKNLFNVSGLKQKIRQSSKQCKKQQFKKHKRTVTQADQQIKIKLFSNSFQKMSVFLKDPSKTQIISKALFIDKQKKNSFENIINRTLSSLSQHSLKKGINICSKGKKLKSVSKSSFSNQKIQTKYCLIEKENEKRFQKKKIEENGRNFKQEKDKKQVKREKQNLFQNNKISKINSIMHSIKEGYKIKNTQQKAPSKIKCGIKTTVCV